MIAVSNDFKLAMKEPVKELDAYIELDDETRITSSDNLIQFKISCDTGLCKTAMRKLEAKILGEHNLLGKWLKVGFGVKLGDGTYEYLDYGSFLVTETTSVKDTETTTITGYDKMINTMTRYTPINIEYPIGLYDYTVELCNAFGLEVANESFEVHNDWQVERELWENINGITYRDILQQIAQVTCSNVIITNDDKIYFKPLTDTNETLTYDNMLKLKLEPIYGEINSVVLSRTPQEDNVYMKDDESIEEYGLTEWKIENNEIIDKDRDNAMTPIYNAMHGISFYPFETNTEGLGWYEIGDSFNIINENGDAFNTTLFNFSITIDGGIKEILKTTAETKTQTQYQYATTIDKRVKNTEIIVDKQEQNIQSLVSDISELDGIINENFTQIYQNIENVITNVQTSGGNNLLKNSVMFAYNEKGIPDEWDTNEDLLFYNNEQVLYSNEEISYGGIKGLIIQSDTEALNAGSISAHSFTLSDGMVKQKVIVVPNADESGKNFYTFNTKIKKNTAGYCYVKIYNANEEYMIELNNGTSAYYEDYSIQAMFPTMNYFIVEFYGDADSGATFTDNMFSVGEYPTQWSQANGEIMNTQVNININGVLVKSAQYAGNYTIMSPLEFSGYANVNGVTTKVFSLNNDVTEVEKLKARKEIRMIPIKIVPITSGNMQGWAFVEDTGGDD